MDFSVKEKGYAYYYEKSFDNMRLVMTAFNGPEVPK